MLKLPWKFNFLLIYVLFEHAQQQSKTHENPLLPVYNMYKYKYGWLTNGKMV